MTIQVVCLLMSSFKTVLKSICRFFVDRLARNVHFNTNPIGFLLNQPKSNQDILGINMNIHTKYEVSVTIYVGRRANQRKSTITSAI